MPDSNGNSPSSRTGLACGGKPRLLRICAITGFSAGLVVIWMFGFSLWTAIVFVLLIGCPVVIVWLLVIDRQSANRRKP